MTDAQLAERVHRWTKEGKEIKLLIAARAARLIDSLCRHYGGLRELARMIELSPTYLCEIRKKRIWISPDAFLRLAKHIPMTKERIP